MIYKYFHDFAFSLTSFTDKIIIDNFNKITATEKNTGDIVTKVDLEIEKFLTKKIKETYPDYKIFGEEMGGKINFNQSNYTWLIDPLDGTNNYALGIPMFETAITLLKGYEVIVSIITLPFVNKVYSSFGDGVLLNNKKYTLSETKKSKRISMLVGYKTIKNKEEYSKFLEMRKNVQLTTNRIFETWCPVIDFALLLEGQIDTILFYNNEFYDSLPGIFLAEQIGFEVVNSQNVKFNFSGQSEISAKINSIRTLS